MKKIKTRKIHSTSNLVTFKSFKKGNWGIFKKLAGNREIALKSDKYKKLLKSTSENGEMFGNGRVNEKMEVIDGQHRLAACVQLGLPFYYEIQENATIKDAQKMNSNSKSWTFIDYAKSYAEGGNKNYKEYLRIAKMFPTLKHVSLKIFLTNCARNNGTEKWNEGLFEVAKLSYKIEDICTKFAEVVGFFSNGAQQSFAAAFLIAYKNPEYDHKRMISGAQRFINKHRNVTGGLLKISNDVSANCDLLTAMYNFGRRPKNRVTLAKNY